MVVAACGHTAKLTWYQHADELTESLIYSIHPQFDEGNDCLSSNSLHHHGIARYVGAQPFGKLLEIEVVGLIEPGNECVCGFCIRCNMRSVYGEKGVGSRKGRPLVAVYERMALRQALPESSRFLDHISVVAGLGPI